MKSVVQANIGFRAISDIDLKSYRHDPTKLTIEEFNRLAAPVVAWECDINRVARFHEDTWYVRPITLGHVVVAVGITIDAFGICREISDDGVWLTVAEFIEEFQHGETGV